MEKEIIEILEQQHTLVNNELTNGIMSKPNICIAQKLNALFAKRIVSQQRELLADFLDSTTTYDFECLDTETIVDNYISKANCG